MKIYVICDLEGIAGVADQVHQCSFTHDEYGTDYVPGTYGPFYLQARRLATLELNALVEGAVAGGATEVVAWDGHCRFPGGLDAELLHPDCTLVMNAGDGGPVGFDATFDALMLHGAHAKKGTPAASQAHMLFPGLQWNGAEIGEIGMNIALAGELEVPVIFVSGDRAAVQETREFVPDLETVVVKEALFTHAADIFEHAPVLSLAPARSRDLIRAAARRAVERLADFAPPPKPPFDVTTQ